MYGAVCSIGRVAEILEDDNTEIVCVAGDGRDGQRHDREQPRDVDEGQLGEFERRVVHGQDDRRIIRAQHAEVLPGRGVASERYDADIRPGDPGALETLVDPGSRVVRRWRAPIH